MDLTKDITLEELTVTTNRKYIDVNYQEALKEPIFSRLKNLAINLLQPISTKYNNMVIINSGYRCKDLNSAVGGSATSQHCLGEASDFYIKGKKLREVFDWIKNDSKLMYSQLILECYNEKNNTGWIHIGLPMKDRLRQNLIASKDSKGNFIYNAA